jgi:hypothetical protein
VALVRLGNQECLGLVDGRHVAVPTLAGLRLAPRAAWILYLDTVPDAGTEFHWQDHHEEAVKGKLAIFPAGLSHLHRGRVSQTHSKTIATGWINAGTLDAYVARLAAG